MNDYHWLLTVKDEGSGLSIVSLRDGVPNPGDLVTLEDGSITMVVTASLFHGDSPEYQEAISLAPVSKAVRLYNKRRITEDPHADS